MTTTIYNVDSEPLYEVSAFTFSETDMGEASITCDIYLPQDVDPQFSLDWYIDYLGEKFYLSTLQPPALKDNSLLRYKYSLTFKSEREDLKRYDMLDIVKSNEGDPIPDKYSFSFQGTIEQFIDRFNANLQYNFGTRWEMRLAAGVTSERVIVSCQDGVKMWDLLTQVYDLYGVRWYIAAEGNKMVIFVGYAPTEIEHIFEYDPDKTDGTATGGLYSIERVNPLNDIYTRMRGTGGTKNLPYRYFKAQSQVEGEKQYPADPDYNTVIANNSYPNLMPKCFRDYLKGWNGTALSPETAAYQKGKADRIKGKFIPMDYVISDKESKWGVKYGALQANEEIYPTIQGVWDDQLGRIDEIVAVSDLPEEASGEDSSTATTIAENVVLPRMNWYTDGHAVMVSKQSAEFEVSAEQNKIKAHFSALRYNVNDVQIDDSDLSAVIPVYASAYLRNVETDITFNIISANTNLSAEGVDGSVIVPAGRYVLFVKAQPQSPHTFSSAGWASVTASDITTQAYSDSTEADLSQTFNIWIKDVGFDIREPQYWAVGQGDMAVMFSDGLLAGEDYEFTIAAEKSGDTYTKIYVAEDTSKNIRSTNEQGDPITVRSKWRITLIRSEAEYEASGRLLPNSVVNAKAGDHFFFINIQLPQKYVEWAEERLQSYIETELSKVDDEYPTFTVKPSAIFCADFSEADKLRAGARIRIRNQRLIGDGYLVVYITSLTLTHSADKILPTWDMVVSETPSASQNAISLLQGQVEQLSQNVYSSSTALAEAVAQMDRIFLRADGLADTSYSATTFTKPLTLGDILRSAGFRQAGFAGSGWGIFKDANGNWTLEIDRINLRKDLSVNTVTVNQLSFLYGKYIYARGGIVVTSVDEVEGGYKLYFDTENGNHPNPFVVGDQAYSLNFNTEAYEVEKYYWALVTEVGTDYIVISTTDKDGDGVPMAGDKVAQFGNRTDAYRQQALVIDQIEGGSIVQYAHIGDPEATDGAFSLQDRAYAGFEYDPITGEPRMFSYGDLLAGDRDPLAEDAEYVRFTKDEGKERRTLKIKGQVTIQAGSSGLTNLAEWAPVQEQLDSMGYITEALKGSTTISGGLILTSLISLLDQDGSTKSGINGIYDAEKLGGGIAAWYGGDMADKFDYYYWDETDWTLKPKPDVEIPESIAQGVDRMDGTGYRAGGNFWWDSDGNIHADPLSFFVGEETVGNVLALFRFNYKPDSIDKPFEDVLSVTPMRKFTELQIGDAIIEWDDTNNAVVFRTADRSGLVGIYGEYTSAKGANPDAGQGGGGTGGATALSQLTDVLLASLTSGDILSYNGSKWVNIPQSSITPDLAGYATQAWVKQQGYITVASLSGYATQSWVQEQGFLTAIPTEYITESDLEKKGYALSTTKVIAGTGLTGGGALTGDVTLSLASRTLWGQTYDGSKNISGDMTDVGSIIANGESHFSNGTFSDPATAKECAIKVSHDAAFGANVYMATKSGSVGIGTLNPEYKLDVAGAIRAQTRIYFNDSHHYIELDSDGHFHFSHGVYSDEYLSVKGSNPEAGSGGGGGATALSQLTDVSLSGLALGQLLMYNGSTWTNVAQSTIIPTLKSLTFGSKTYNGTTAQTITAADLGALTSHQTLYSLAFQAGGFEAKTYTPNVGAQTVNIPTNTSHLTNDSGFATKLGVSGNQIGTYVNGKLVTLITVPYAANADKVDGYDALRLQRDIYTYLTGTDVADNTTDPNTLTGGTGIDGFRFYDTKFYTSASASSRRTQIAYPYNSMSNIQYRVYSTSWSSWKTVANIDDNVASATKLQTARTIWGQSFNGTAPISGDMTDVGSIIANGESHFSNGTFSDPATGKMCAIKVSHDAAFGANVFLSTKSGGVSIGATAVTSGYKLDVNGNIKANDVDLINVNVATKIRIKSGVSSTSISLRNDPNLAISVDSLYGLYAWVTGDGNGHIQVGREDRTGTYYNLILQELGGKVGINTKSPAYPLDVTGAIHATTGIFTEGYVSAKGQNTASDARLKTYMEDIELTVSDIANAPAWRYKWKSDGSIDAGSTTQYWGAIVPELIHKLPDGKYYGLDYGKTALLSVIAVARTVQSHEERIAELERENEQLKQTLKKYIS